MSQHHSSVHIGFCGNCGESHEVVRILDWYPNSGHEMPYVNLCRPCLKLITEDWDAHTIRGWDTIKGRPSQ